MRKAVFLPMLGGFLIFLALASIMYQSTFAYLLGQWGLDDFTYSYFIPPVVAYLIWEKRAELAREPACRTWAGLLPVLLAMVCFWMGELGGEFTIMFVSCWLLGVGALWCLLGRRKLSVIGFPTFLVLVMVPPPMVFYNGLTLWLKLLSSRIGVLMLQACGLSAYREGNVIDLGFTKLQVVDACSGLRYFFPLIILGILLAYFYKGSLWKKIFLVASAVPISIVTNSMRIASVGILYQFMGPAAAEGFFHEFSGWFIFMVSLAIMVLELAVMKRILPVWIEASGADRARPAGEFPAPAPPRPGGRFRLVAPQFIVILLLMGGSAAAVQGVSERNRTPLARPLSGFPENIGGWTGKRQVMEKIYLDGLELTDYLLADFRDSRGGLVNCYVAYNDCQSKGKASHSPASCLPGTGWELKDAARVALSDGAGHALTVNRAMMVMGSQRRIIYYWFDERGRILTDLYQIKLFNMVDSVTRNRTDGALIRLIAPLAEGESPAAADARLTDFFRQFNPELSRFLPAGASS